MSNKQRTNNEEAPAMGVARASMSDLTTTKGDNMNSSTQTASAQLPVIAGHEIAMDEHGRFNLNAIHKASEAGQTKRPSVWRATKQTQELIAELETQSQNSGFAPLEAKHGGKTPGTFAHELLAISYAGWISPRFQLQVNQVFLDYRMGRLQQIERQVEQQKALPNPLTPEHQRGIQKAVARKAQSLPKSVQRLAYSKLYSHLKDRFGVAKYDQIEDSRYTEALGAIQSFELEGELMEPAQALPQMGLTEEERHDLYLLSTHISWALHYWLDYRVEASLRALGSPAGARIGEHLKVASIYGRRILREHADLMNVSKARLGLDHLTLEAI